MATRLKPWWERQLPKLGESVRRQARASLPHYRGYDDDLAAETILHLVERLRRQPRGFPAAWFARGKARPSKKDRDYLFRLVYVIARRRIIDLFRSPAPRQPLTHARETLCDSQAEKTLLLRRMLEVCERELERMPAADRTILAEVSGSGDSAKRALPAKARQRLRRARARLLKAVQRQMGETAVSLLSGGQDE